MYQDDSAYGFLPRLEGFLKKFSLLSNTDYLFIVNLLIEALNKGRLSIFWCLYERLSKNTGFKVRFIKENAKAIYEKDQLVAGQLLAAAVEKGCLESVLALIDAGVSMNLEIPINDNVSVILLDLLIGKEKPFQKFIVLYLIKYPLKI